MSNLADVAALAGVSISTVSRVLNSKARTLVAEPTAERVRQVAAQLGYRPSAAAQALVTGRSRTVAFCCYPSYDSNMADVIRRLHEDTRASGYHLLVVDSHDTDETCALLAEQRVDAVIWTRYPVHEADALTASLSAPHQVIVAVGEIEERVPRKVCSAVWGDRQGMRVLLEHLGALGHRHVAFLGGVRDTLGSKRLAFERGCAELGLRGDLIWVEDETDRIGAGVAMAEQALTWPEPPTALVGRHDDFAFGALYALHEAGLSVPDDMSVAGYHDHREGVYSRPALTTVHTPELQGIGIALAAAVAALEGNPSEQAEPTCCRLAAELVVRSSTGAPRTARTTKG